jgi:hypothetical protein
MLKKKKISNEICKKHLLNLLKLYIEIFKWKRNWIINIELKLRLKLNWIDKDKNKDYRDSKLNYKWRWCNPFILK